MLVLSFLFNILTNELEKEAISSNSPLSNLKLSLNNQKYQNSLNFNHKSFEKSSFTLYNTKFSKLSNDQLTVNRGKFNVYDTIFTESIQPIYIERNMLTPYGIEEIDYKERISYEEEIYTFTKCSFHSLSSNSTDNEEVNGGAIFGYEAMLFFNYCLFIENKACSGGVGMFNRSMVYSIGSNYSKNIASKDGGVFSLYKSNCTVIKCNFVLNHAGTKGGVMRLLESTLDSSKSLYQENTDVDSAGAIASEYSKIYLETDRFIDNDCYNKEGGIIFSLEHSLLEIFVCKIVTIDKYPEKIPFSVADEYSEIFTKNTEFDIELDQIYKYVNENQFHESESDSYGEEEIVINKVPAQEPYDVVNTSVEVDSEIMTDSLKFSLIYIGIAALIICIFVIIKPSYKKRKPGYMIA